MEKLLAGLISIDDAKAMMSPLFGINDLRGACAHLGTSLIGSGMERAEVDDRLPLPMQGRQLIQSFVNAIKRIEAAISLR
ncbi:hypothetical protein DUT91_16475 [Phyllobacterium salinisoli]|uniref:Uncharacterized protein n=1 Tax=Phyllobacterium salinisoli TaxID=1899321 RepID=A0A368JZE9_9HYPH|nr:hypothetical protein [Phyllobacterium salinisoli]RCS22518.1 hypothetical protein DUT91_16475 [Phyllobacterium salinisoli]